MGSSQVSAPLVATGSSPYDSFTEALLRLLKTCSKLQSVHVVLIYYHRVGFAALHEVRGLRHVSVELSIGPASSTWREVMEEMADDLKTAMTRPRPSGYASGARELDLFEGRRPRKTECENLVNRDIEDPVGIFWYK